MLRSCCLLVQQPVACKPASSHGQQPIAHGRDTTAHNYHPPAAAASRVRVRGSRPRQPGLLLHPLLALPLQQGLPQQRGQVPHERWQQWQQLQRAAGEGPGPVVRAAGAEAASRSAAGPSLLSQGLLEGPGWA